jgi:hypothetical protein
MAVLCMKNEPSESPFVIEGVKMAKVVEQIVEIKKINIQRTTIELVGDSSLIVHAWSAKAKKEMLDKQMKKAKNAKIAKDPEKDYEDSFYRLPDGSPGFPAIAFKSAAVSAGGRFSDGLKMTELRGSFHIEGELVQIIGEPTMREDMVRIGMGTADIRYRPEFLNWRVRLPIRYNADAISLEQIVNLFNLGGFGVGVGEWRPERDGPHGMFHVATESEGKK